MHTCTCSVTAVAGLFLFFFFFFREKALWLLDRSNPITSNAPLHVKAGPLLHVHCSHTLTCSRVLELQPTSPGREVFQCAQKTSITTCSNASFYAESREVVEQTSYTHGNYHTQTLASFTGIPKVLSPLQGLFSYTISVFTCSHPF